MSNHSNQDQARYLQEVSPTFMPLNQQPKTQSANSHSAYRLNPAFRPPHREPIRHNVYDIPYVEDVSSRPTSKKGKRGGPPAVPTTPLSLMQTTTPPDSRKQAMKTSRPGQAKNTKSFPNTKVSKPNFFKHRSDSNNDKSSPNLFSSAPPITEDVTTLQCGIAMTTMQKLAAFPYQPSSTGSIHKAVLCSTEAPSHTISTLARMASEKQARTLPTTVNPYGEVTQASRNREHETLDDSRGTHYRQIHACEDNLGHLPDLDNVSYPRSDSPVLVFDRQRPQADPVSVASVPAYSHFRGSASSHIVANFDSEMPSLAPSDNLSYSSESVMVISQSCSSVDPSMLSNSATPPAAQSTPDTGNWNSEYDRGLEDPEFRNLNPLGDSTHRHMPLSIARKPNPANVPAQASVDPGDLDQYSIQPSSQSNDGILGHDAFKDLTAAPWDHMDYATHNNPDGNQTNQVDQSEGIGAENMDVDTTQDAEQWQNAHVNREDGTDYNGTSADHVHSHEQVANSELSTTRNDLLFTHGQATEPQEDTEDYFAVLGDLDDEDFRELEIPSSGKDGEKNASAACKSMPVSTVPKADDGDYLAAFRDFTDEDFKNIEIPSENGQLKKTSNVHQTLSRRSMPMAIQVPATQFDVQAQHRDYPQSIMPTIAASSAAFPQYSRDDSVDDEYPLDEGEQAEFEQLQASEHHAVLETREPPSSILHSEEDMRDMVIYDNTLSYSPVVPNQPKTSALAQKLQEYQAELDEPLTDPEDWEFLRSTRNPQSTDTATTLAAYTDLANAQSSHLIPAQAIIDDDDYSPLPPFARPPFPAKVPARSPITGISSAVVLRTCFRIGEALSQASLCTRDNQDAVTELFARVTFSARETDGKKQNFQFGDIFHNKPPFISGVLEKYATSDLQKTESSELITVNKEKRAGELGEMVRVLGRVKRVIQGRGYTMDIINIRKTDWEKVRWTQRILGA